MRVSSDTSQPLPRPQHLHKLLEEMETLIIVAHVTGHGDSAALPEQGEAWWEQEH